MSITIKNVTFDNVPNKKLGTIIPSMLTQSNIKMSLSVNDYLNSDDFYTLVSALDIDWGSIKIDKNIVINDTADLINWIKNLEGLPGPKGDTGEGFSIYKTYASISEMNSDVANVPEGKFVLIASNTEDADNAKLYVKDSTKFSFLSDLSGAQGILGPKGDKGDKGDTGPQGPKGDKGDKGDTGTFDASMLEDYATKQYIRLNIKTINEQSLIGEGDITISTVSDTDIEGLSW